MAAFDNIVGRADVEGVIPVEASLEIIADAPKTSVVLARARRVPMGSGQPQCRVPRYRRNKDP